MWTHENRPKYNRDHLRYPSDLTDDEWAHVELLIPPAKPGGGIALLATLLGRFAFLAKLFADSAYQGPIFGNALAKILPCLETEIVKRSDQAKGFVRLPKRWIVERTIAWLNRCRRLAKDWENLNRNALAFLKLASIRLMLRKLCNP